MDCHRRAQSLCSSWHPARALETAPRVKPIGMSRGELRPARLQRTLDELSVHRGGRVRGRMRAGWYEGAPDLDARRQPMRRDDVRLAYGVLAQRNPTPR